MLTSWHKPLLRRVATLALALAATAGVGGAAGAQPARAASAKAFDDAVLRELNRVRAHHGLARLRHDRRMNRTAGSHSRRMARSRSIWHGAWSGRVARAAGRHAGVGEVLAWIRRGSPRREAAQVVQWWLASPSHRSVILRGSFRRAGIGRATVGVRGAHAAIYTVDFATGR